MGKAKIVENIGEGLYLATPQWDFSIVDLELLALQQQQDKYNSTLLKALNTKTLVERDVTVAKEALNTIIKQWKQAIIDKAKTAAPLVPPSEIDPNTGEPWEDEDRAQDQLLLDAINTLRSSNSISGLTRDTRLDTAALRYLQYQGNLNRTGHIDQFGRQASDRVAAVGYGASEVHELLAYGESTVAEVLATFNRDKYSVGKLLESWDNVGVAYRYGRNHYAAHLWCVLLAKIGTPPAAVEVTDDPVTNAIVEEDGKLNKIEVPRLEDLSPDQLGKVTQDYGVAIGKLRLAEREIERITVENVERNKRIAELQGIKGAAVPIHVWCVNYNQSLRVGEIVDSIEVPGFWKESGTPKTTVLYKDNPALEVTVNWTERSWNLSTDRTVGQDTGRLVPAVGLTDAAVFVNIALEAGHLKWKPNWRYGIMTAKGGGLATVEFSEEMTRPISGENSLSIQRFYSYSGVRFNYGGTWGSEIFLVGDEVVVAMKGTNHDQLEIIGWRREPRTLSKRMSWRQISNF